jgi:hypothetical protein
MDEWRAFDGMAGTSFTGVSSNFVVLCLAAMPRERHLEE